MSKTTFHPFSRHLFQNYSSKKAVQDVAQTGRICLLDVDKQGVKNIRKTDLNPLFIYISPPSYEILEQRLRGRQTDTEAAIEKRLKEAKESMEFSKEPGMYDHIILNDQLEVAYQAFRAILRQVCHQIHLLDNLSLFLLLLFSGHRCRHRTTKFQSIKLLVYISYIIRDDLSASFSFFFVPVFLSLSLFNLLRKNNKYSNARSR